MKIEPGTVFSVMLLALPLVLSGCGTTSGPRKSAQADSAGRPPVPGRGGYYLDDGPGDNPPANLDDIPDAVPKIEPINRATSRPYSVMGRSYAPMTDLTPYRERGLATWYGRRYHGKPTSSGETYDMYRMTAAHTTLPIPSYARVTNVDNGRSVVVRINDRGPFIGDRLIDLSYVAAHKLDVLRTGSVTVEVESVFSPNQVSAIAPSRSGQRPLPAVVAAPVEPLPQKRTAAEPPAVNPPVVNPAVVVSAPTVGSAMSANSPMGNPLAAVNASMANAPLATPPSMVNQPGHYVQLGAFSVKENAERFLERTRALMQAEQPTVSVVPAGALYRVQAGPYADRSAAEQAALRFEALLGATPVLTSPR